MFNILVRSLLTQLCHKLYFIYISFNITLP